MPDAPMQGDRIEKVDISRLARLIDFDEDEMEVNTAALRFGVAKRSDQTRLDL